MTSQTLLINKVVAWK